MDLPPFFEKRSIAELEEYRDRTLAHALRHDELGEAAEAQLHRDQAAAFQRMIERKETEGDDMANPQEKVIHEIQGKNGGKVKIADVGDGNVIIRANEPTVVVSKADIKEAAKKITDIE